MRDLTGEKFTKLKVIDFFGKDKTNQRLWKCKCDCGNEIEVKTSHLTGEYVKSCGCLKNPSGKDSPTYKHGMKGTPIYSCWQHMKQRCNNSDIPQYKDYGGRGIEVCERWNDFEKFYEDMGDDYKEGLTIERIDNDGNYTPENCRWATRDEQARNTRRNVIIKYKGKEYILMDLAKEIGINYHTLYGRIFTYDWSVKKAVETPVNN